MRSPSPGPSRPSRRRSRSPSRSPPRRRRSQSLSRSPPRRRRSYSPSQSPPRRRPSYSPSRSPPRRRRYSPSRSPSRSRSPPGRRHRSRSPLPTNPHRRPRSPPAHRRPDRQSDRGGRGRGKHEWGRPEDRNREEQEEIVEKELPNFGASGKLASETNTVKGVELKYNEPPDAAQPKKHWRLYVFKGSEQIDLLHLHRQSSFLVGRDRVVADIPVDHLSCSKQHAVVQFRLVTAKKTAAGEPSATIKPYMIDLESTNGTFVNDQQVPATRFVELRHKDVIKFGNSTREYVLLLKDAE